MQLVITVKHCTPMKKAPLRCCVFGSYAAYTTLQIVAATESHWLTAFVSTYAADLVINHAPSSKAQSAK
eukprot:15663-Heterococcus_DN1.PRE.1